MASFKDLKRQIYEEVAERVTGLGFKKRVSRRSYEKDFPEGKMSFHLAYISHARDFHVTVDVAVRFDALEDLVNADEIRMSEKDKKSTFSFGVELGNLSIGEQRRWVVANQSDIANVADSIVSAFREIGVPYLETYSDMEMAYELLSRDDPGVWKHAPIHELGARSALGLAYLLGKRDLADLVNRKTQELHSFLEADVIDETDMEKFLRFSSKLN